MITVRVTRHELTTLPGEKLNHHDVLATPRAVERHILDRLRNAGIPIQGVTFLVALERGELSIRRDFGDYVYTWRE